MQRPRLLSLAAGLVLLLALLVPSARAEDPDRSAWLQGHAYQKGAGWSVGDRAVEAYLATDVAADAEAEVGLVRLLVVHEGEVAESYRLDSTKGEGEQVRLDLFWEDAGAGETGVRVTISLVRATTDLLQAARAALDVALAAGPGWRAASEKLAQAVGEEDLSGRRALALEAYRALERVHREHGAHLGVLRDLLVADQLLVPLEAGSDRGANLAFAWRQHVAAVRLFGDEGEQLEALRTTAVCALAEGCYGLAAVTLQHAALEGDEGLILLQAALVRVSQDQQEVVTTTGVVGRTGTLAIQILRCPTQVQFEGFLIHRLTFLLATPEQPDEPQPAWFSLTSETVEGRGRWALYGWVGGSRRLLRLYGSEEPDAQAVTDEVVKRVREAVRGEEGK